MTPEERFGQRVRELRKINGWSQQELADRLDARGIRVHQSVVNKLEAAKRPTPVGEVIALAETFGVHPGELIGEQFATGDRLAAAEREKRMRVLLDAQFQIHQAAQAITGALGSELRGAA